MNRLPLTSLPTLLLALAGGPLVAQGAPSPAQPSLRQELIRRYAMFQGATFMVSGFAEFPKAAAHEMHTEMLLKGRFFNLVDATVTMIGVAGKSWTQPNIYVNRDQMLSLFMG